MTTLDQLDEQALLDLNRRTSRLGVLSVYVNAAPDTDPAATLIDLRNRYRELQRRTAEHGSAHHGSDTTAALRRLEPEVERLASPAEPGRGRIAFAALDGEWLVRVTSQMPVGNRVVLDDSAFIHPLLELLDEGRPAGVVLVSGDQAVLLEWRLGELREVQRLEQSEVEAPHERAGQIGGGPPGQFHTPMREHRQDRQRDRMRRFITRVAESAQAMTAERHWERVLVSAGGEWTELLAARLPEALQDQVIRDPRVLAGLDDASLTAAVTDRLHDDHTARERRLLTQVRDAGLGGTGALGLAGVAAALNQARVAHLVYDPEVRYAGYSGPDGALSADAVIQPGDQPGTFDPRLTERLVERALTTGAHVSPIEGAASDVLSDVDGIGALLRW